MRTSRYKRQIRHLSLRKKIVGTSNIPRLSVFRSNKHIYAQLIDDYLGKTIASVSNKNFKETKSALSRLDQAYEVGLALAKSVSSKKIKKIVFDRGGYKYHGRVKSLAEGARKGGLSF